MTEENEQGQPPATEQGELDKDTKMWGLIIHLSGLSGYLANGIGMLLVPLILWLIKREESPFLDTCGKEAVNFQITIIIYAVVCGLLCFVFVGFLLLPILAIFQIVVVVKAAMEANKGNVYRYPFTLRLIS